MEPDWLAAMELQNLLSASQVAYMQASIPDGLCEY